MAETTADVRRDIEMTRERISTTLAQLERKTNVVQIVKDHPWPALAAAVGVGVLLSGSRADIKAAAATAAATKGASSKLGGVLDDAVAHLMGGLHQAFQGHLESIVGDLKQAIGLPATTGNGSGGRSGLVAQAVGASAAAASSGLGQTSAVAGGSWAPQSDVAPGGGNGQTSYPGARAD